VTRAGDVLSILQKRQGRWVIVRDANMLAPVRPHTSTRSRISMYGVSVARLYAGRNKNATIPGGVANLA
jgi:hypothetical protein